MTPSSGNRYKVCCAPKDLEQLKAWGKKAAKLGMRDAFIAALKTINDRLATDPLAWGDPYFHLRQLGLLCCHGIHAMLHVYFAVDDEKKLVFVKEFKILPGHPLEGQG
ncbi:hypothetical protein AYO44_10085 [Planctomycetaceae bacterium SCGC AG-212-F19]|nr:hypothetical protein AYO44_10085 [Planctomycetaceae bacterium SCGC AG-212-F19]